MEPEAALALGQRAVRAEEALRLTLTSTRAYWTTRLAQQGELHEIDLDAKRQKREAVEARLPAWWERPSVLVPATVVFTVLTLELVRSAVD